MGRQWLHAKRAIVNLKKGQVVGKLVKEITVAAKLGGPDPEGNARLFAVLEKARKAGVTRDAIERAVAKGSGTSTDKSSMEQVWFEGYAPHKVPVMVEVYTDNLSRSTTWQPRPNDPELEKEFLRRIMVKLAPATPSPDKAMDQVAASSASNLISLNGKPAVSFNQGFDIAWRRVGVALDRNGFTVEDRDRKQGIYFVRYVEVGPEGEEGFFSKWFGKAKSGAQGPQQYRLKLQNGDAGGTTILILNSSGEPDGSANAQKIAQLLVSELQ